MRHLLVSIWASLVLAALPPAPAQAQTTTTPDPAMARLRSKLNPELAPWSPAYVFERCAEHLATINKYDRKRIRYFDVSSTPRALLPTGASSLFFGTNSAARTPVTRVPQAVPNTDNRIFWIDLCWFNWSPETWEKISEEDPYFREPIIPSDSQALLFLKKETNANPVIRGDWFLYYVYDNSQFLKLGQEFNDEAFYYLLVYSNVEFHREVTEAVEKKVTETKSVQRQFTDAYGRIYYQTVQEPTTRTVKETKKVRKLVRGIGPRTAAEFQEAWKVNFDVLKDYPIDQGALIDVSHSGVSWENRIVWRVRTAIGTYWRTFDVMRAVGDQDFIENPFPKGFDAGEHIIQDNRGAQFYHLSNGKDESIDFADPRVVNNQTPFRVLTTAGACIHCHDNGIIGFKNEHRRLAEIGAKLQAVDYNRAERFNQFYLQDRRLQKNVETDQGEYAEFIRDCNGLTPQENAAQFGKYRAWYGKPVTLEQAAREVGCDKDELSDAIGLQGTKGRLGALVLDGTPIPRQTWERGMFQEAALLLIEWRKKGKINLGGGSYPQKR